MWAGLSCVAKNAEESGVSHRFDRKSKQVPRSREPRFAVTTGRSVRLIRKWPCAPTRPAFLPSASRSDEEGALVNPLFKVEVGSAKRPGERGLAGLARGYEGDRRVFSEPGCDQPSGMPGYHVCIIEDKFYFAGPE